MKRGFVLLVSGNPRRPALGTFQRLGIFFSPRHARSLACVLLEHMGTERPARQAPSRGRYPPPRQLRLRHLLGRNLRSEQLQGISRGEYQDDPTAPGLPDAQMRSLPALLYQVLDVSSQSFCNALKHSDRRVALTAFDTAEIGLVDTGEVGELLLREALLASEPLKVKPDTLPHIHAGRSRACSFLLHRL